MTSDLTPTDVPRWEDVDLGDIDYEARDGLPSGHERTLQALRSKIDSTEAMLRRYFRELGVSAGGNLTRLTIPTHVQYRDPFAFARARSARSAQTTLGRQRNRFCKVYAAHCAEKVHLREEAEVEDDGNTDNEEAVST
jgi:isopentenyldiphosphate isomerase